MELPESSPPELSPLELSPREALLAEPNPWRENHGNLLLGVVAAILLIGSAVLAYRQLGSRTARAPIHVVPQASDETMRLEQAGLDEMAARRMITVRIFGAASDRGLMKLAVYIAAEGFNDPDRALGIDSWTIRDGICEGQFGLPIEIEKLAIAAYHDENNNGQLDRNPLGIPAERYGFSGGARGLVGAPQYAEAVVRITDEPIDISIR